MGACALLQAAERSDRCDAYLSTALPRLENSARHTMSRLLHPAAADRAWWHLTRLCGFASGHRSGRIEPEQHFADLQDDHYSWCNGEMTVHVVSRLRALTELTAAGRAVSDRGRRDTCNRGHPTTTRASVGFSTPCLGGVPGRTNRTEILYCRCTTDGKGFRRGSVQPA